jgi:hypothetical protein
LYSAHNFESEAVVVAVWNNDLSIKGFKKLLSFCGDFVYVSNFVCIIEVALRNVQSSHELAAASSTVLKSARLLSM